MRAAVYDENEVNIKDVPQPVPTNSQVLVRIKAAGICGTDLAIVKGNLPTPTPLILGHEFAGEVVQIGKDVHPSWLGKRVTSEINSNIDYDCYYCKRNIFSQCISRKALGIDINGGFSDFIAVESYLLHEFPQSISFEEATFIEPLASAYQTFEMMPLKEEDKSIAIFGMGKLGLLILQVAKTMEIELIAVDNSEKKLTYAKKFGATYPMNRFEKSDIVKEIRDVTNGLGADVVIDATGNPNALNDVVASCRTRGKIHVKSTHGLATPINLTDIVVREITLYSSRCGPFNKAIEGLKSGKIFVKELISEKYSLEEIQIALDSYEKNKDHIKSILLIE